MKNVLLGMLCMMALLSGCLDSTPLADPNQPGQLDIDKAVWYDTHLTEEEISRTPMRSEQTRDGDIFIEEWDKVVYYSYRVTVFDDGRETKEHLDTRIEKENYRYTIIQTPEPEPEPDIMDTRPSLESFGTGSVGAHAFYAYCVDNWQYTSDKPYQQCHHPYYSYNVMTSDCDDFAVMVAGILQEDYNVNTLVLCANVRMRNGETGGHAITLAKTTADPDTLNWWWRTATGNYYTFLDMGGEGSYGIIEVIEVYDVVEWYELVGKII